MKRKRRPLTVTVSNPEAIEKASEKLTALLYELYMKSLCEKRKDG